jgi:sterol 3beta-glucosyltransferase
VLGLAPLPARFFLHLGLLPLPIIYGFSPNLLLPPADWGEWVKVSEHWFLDIQQNYQLPDNILRFLEAGMPPVYIRFRSMVDEQIQHTTPIVVETLLRCGQRGIQFGGWG